jgi:alpha-galactosidase
MQLYWSGGDQYRAYNVFRRTMLAHVVPKCNGRTATPPIVHMSTSFYELNGSTEANVLSHLEAVKGLGFEMFWLDAYWTRDGFPAGMGHYGFPIERAEPRDRFPRGIQPIRDAVHQAGLKYLMWFEPERVHPGTAIAKEHPEWVISPNGDGSGLFNLGTPETRQFMTRYLTTVIKEYGLDCLRIDFNIDPLPFWEFLNQQASERAGIGEIRYIEGLYQMWDELLAAYPHLLIDNCASGGRRIDLETCSRALPLWRSDNTCDMVGSDPARIAHAAIKNQLMSLGLNRYVPFSTVGQMGSTPYLFRSGFNGGIAFGEDCRGAAYPRDLLGQAIAEGKRIRPYWFGNFYPLSEPTLDPAAWCVLQYHRPAESDGIVVCFRRERSPYAAFDCQLREIDSAADYEITLSPSYQPGPPVTITGAELLRYRAVIGEKPGSLICEYRKAAQPQAKVSVSRN